MEIYIERKPTRHSDKCLKCEKPIEKGQKCLKAIAEFYQGSRRGRICMPCLDKMIEEGGG